MATAIPLKFNAGHDTAHLTEPIVFSPPTAAKKTDKPQTAELSLGSVSTGITLFKVIIGIFFLLRFMKKGTLFNLRKKYAARKPQYAKKQTGKSRLRKRGKLTS